MEYRLFQRSFRFFRCIFIEKKESAVFDVGSVIGRKKERSPDEIMSKNQRILEMKSSEDPYRYYFDVVAYIAIQIK